MTTYSDSDRLDWVLNHKPVFNDGYLRVWLGSITAHDMGFPCSSAYYVLNALNAEDVFSGSVKVYSHEPGKIVEHICEVPGWPNVTHAGELMYQYCFSTDKSLVISWAKQDAQRRCQNGREAIEQLQEKIIAIQGRLVADEAWESELQRMYPEIACAV